MSAPLEDQLQQAMVKLGEHQKALVDARRELEEASASVMSKDRMVTATVGAKGDVRSLTFHTTGYRSMAQAELAAALVEVINKAHQQMAEKVIDTFSPFQGVGSLLRESMTGGTELEDLFAPLRALQRSMSATEEPTND